MIKIISYIFIADICIPVYPQSFCRFSVLNQSKYSREKTNGSKLDLGQNRPQLDIKIFNSSKLASRETALEGLTPAYTGFGKEISYH